MQDEERLPVWFSRLLLAVAGFIVVGWVGAMQIGVSKAAEGLAAHESRIQLIERNYATKEDLLRSEARIKDCIARAARGQSCEAP